MTLTDEEIKIKIVESLGWIKQPSSGAYWSEKYVKGKLPSIYESEVRVEGIDFFARSERQLPNYPESLDACAEFEATFADDDEFSERYWLALYDVTQNTRWPYDATARQRCLAYLKTKGLIP